MRFEPAYRSGVGPFGVSYVESFRGVRKTDDVTGLDYVIYKLYTRLGDTVGWMGSQGSSGDDFYYSQKWTSVGYRGDAVNGQIPMIETGIGFDDVDDEGERSWSPTFTRLMAGLAVRRGGGWMTNRGLMA